MGLYMANELSSIQMLQDVYHSEAPTVSIHVCTQRHTFRGRNISEVPWGAYHVHVKLVQTGAGSKKESEQSTWHIAEELGILHPSREAYMGLVRPITEYATTAWSPHTQKDIQCVESVQRRAARFVHKDYSRHSSVTSMLQSLEWPDLESRRKANDLTMFYKILSRQVNIDFPSDLEGNSNQTRLTRASLRHPYQFRQYFSSINAHKYSFFVRTVSHWNALPNHIVAAKSTALLRSGLSSN